ncbi:MAG: amidase [Thermodesulfobacteriota bacterium]
MPELYQLSLMEMSKLIKEKQLSPLDLVNAHLKRIETLEPKLQAWVSIDQEKVLAQASQWATIIKRRKKIGLLPGIPIGVKDIFYTVDLKTTGGSKIFKDFFPPYEATAVGKLKKEGGIVLGKTATTEFAYADPAPTRNPWNLEHTPGGSSSGSAAAVASGMCPAALGSQTGGSVLRPAAYCGVVGFKPSYGRISRHGVFALAWTLDHVGFLTRTVADAALMLKVLAGGDAHDLACSNRPVPEYQKFLVPPLVPPKLGIVREFYQEKSEQEVWANFEETVEKMRRAGAEIADVKMPPSFSLVHDAHRIIMRVEAAAFHEKIFLRHREEYGPKLRELVETGFLISGVDYIQAQKIKNLFRKEMDEVMEKYDCLLTPTTSSVAPRGLSSTGDPWFQVPWSLSGLPTIALPTGLNGEGLPLSLQLIGPAFKEEKLLAAASWCEKALQVYLFPPLS